MAEKRSFRDRMPTVSDMIRRAREHAASVRSGRRSAAEAENIVRAEAQTAAQRWLEGQFASAQAQTVGNTPAQNQATAGGQASNTVTSYPRTAAELAMEAVDRATEQAAQQAQERTNAENRQEILNREIEAQKKLDIRTDPEINRVAELYYSALMQRINFEFGYGNPTWESLGAREKILWLQATELVLDELQKEPVAKNELTALAKRRIIQ